MIRATTSSRFRFASSCHRDGCRRTDLCLGHSTAYAWSSSKHANASPRRPWSTASSRRSEQFEIHCHLGSSDVHRGDRSFFHLHLLQSKREDRFVLLESIFSSGFSTGRRSRRMKRKRKVVFRAKMRDGGRTKGRSTMMRWIKIAKTKGIKKNSTLVRRRQAPFVPSRVVFSLGLDPEYVEFLKQKKEKAVAAQSAMTEEQMQSSFFISHCRALCIR